MRINVTSPFSDNRWEEFAGRHPHASAFHQRGWLEALTRTYGYQLFVLTTTPAGEPLSDGLVLCRVSSWVTGTRLVSLPFSDHCEPLLADRVQLAEFVNWLRIECDRLRCNYVELRLLSYEDDSQHRSQDPTSYRLHILDLSPTVQEIFNRFHRDSIQRKIRRAEREHLEYEAGSSESLLDEFYHLMVMTRRRHHAFPQPRAWFRNLLECLCDKVQIRVVRKSCTPIAAMLNLRHRASVVYKYGCSDERFHNLGGMPFLFWQLVLESKAAGVEKIDLGRSDIDNPGLITFKDRLGAKSMSMSYFRHSPQLTNTHVSRWNIGAVRQLISILPDAVLTAAGSLLYRHIG